MHNEYMVREKMDSRKSSNSSTYFNEKLFSGAGFLSFNKFLTEPYQLHSGFPTEIFLFFLF